MPRGIRANREAPQAPSFTPTPVAAAQAVSGDPLQRGRRVDDMGEVELRQYAQQIGLPRRDAQELQPERLRTACKQQLFDLIEEL